MPSSFRLGLKTLLKAPIVSGLAIVSLGLAIAGNTTVFSMVDAMLLRPLPFRDPDRLVMLWEANPSNPIVDFSLTSADNFIDFSEGATSFEALSAMRPVAASLTEGDRPEPVMGISVSSGFFDIFDGSALLGRVLQPSDHVTGSDRVVVLSYDFWQTRFAGDPGVVGETLELGGEPHLVAGVMGKGFETLDPRIELWKPLVLRRGTEPRDLKNLSAIGRLRADRSLEQARRELAVVASRLARDDPDANPDLAARLVTLREQLASSGNREIMAILQGALLFVLLIASANVANLYLARGVDRQKELAIRTAMGASRARILRQLVLEALVLAVAAGVLGTVLSVWGIRLLTGAFGDQMSAAFAPRLDGRVLAFSMGASLLAGLAFGVAPALSAARASVAGTLHEGGRAGTSGGRRLLTKSIVVAEVSLALVMLAGAAILVRTFAAAQNLDAGVETSDVLVFQLDLSDERYGDPSPRAVFMEELRRELGSLPGVEAATLVDHLPRSPFPVSASFAIDGHTSPEERPSATVVIVDPGYLDVFRVPLFQGRALEETDRLETPRVALVNEAMARAYFPDGSPVGERVVLNGESREIVGVVANVREDLFRFDADALQPIIYLAQGQSPSRRLSVALRAAGDPLGLAGPAREALLAVDPNLSAAELQSMDDFTAQFFVGMRVLNGILAGFGGLALLLAAIGIYGVIAFSVSRRTHEIGLRMALGASRPAVLKLVVREGLLLVGVGFAIGIPGVLLASRLISAALSGMSPFGTSTAALVGAGLFLVALLACYVPARRAASLHPSIALRTD